MRSPSRTEPWAAVGSALAGELFGLVLAGLGHRGPSGQRDALRRRRAATTVAAPTGHDRTTIVCFQDADRPGSLYGILGRFAARDINLTKLESRPTKRGLGDYCFVIEFEGHVADDVVADCLADLPGTPGSGEVPWLLPGYRRRGLRSARGSGPGPQVRDRVDRGDPRSHSTVGPISSATRGDVDSDPSRRCITP